MVYFLIIRKAIKHLHMYIQGKFEIFVICIFFITHMQIRTLSFRCLYLIQKGRIQAHPGV